MPIKRTAALQPLSRQHHNGLLCCLLLQKGLQRNAEPTVMAAFVQDFWYKDLQHHFQLEEQFLLPLQQQYALVEPLLQQMVAEHYRLKEVINAIMINPTTELIDALRSQLNDHIRFEERALFPLIEKSVSPEDLQRIAHVLQHEPDGNCINYPVKFWD